MFTPPEEEPLQPSRRTKMMLASSLDDLKNIVCLDV